MGSNVLVNQSNVRLIFYYQFYPKNCNQVSPYNKVRRVTFVDTIPKSPTGKILRRHLIAISLAIPKLQNYNLGSNQTKEHENLHYYIYENLECNTKSTQNDLMGLKLWVSLSSLLCNFVNTRQSPNIVQNNFLVFTMLSSLLGKRPLRPSFSICSLKEFGVFKLTSYIIHWRCSVDGLVSPTTNERSSAKQTCIPLVPVQSLHHGIIQQPKPAHAPQNG